MKTIKLTDEQLEQYSYADVANLVLEANGKKMKIQDLFSEVIKTMKLPETYFESKIADFFGLLSTDKRFIMLEKGFWDLRINHSHKIVIEDDEEDDDDLTNLEEEMPEDSEDIDENDSEINFDDNKVDDDEDDDDLKDLVILDESEDQDMM